MDQNAEEKLFERRWAEAAYMRKRYGPVRAEKSQKNNKRKQSPGVGVKRQVALGHIGALSCSQGGVSDSFRLLLEEMDWKLFRRGRMTSNSGPGHKKMFREGKDSVQIKAIYPEGNRARMGRDDRARGGDQGAER